MQGKPKDCFRGVDGILTKKIFTPYVSEGSIKRSNMANKNKNSAEPAGMYIYYLLFSF